MVKVRLTEEARDDLLGLYDFLLASDLDVAERALETIGDALRLLEKFPFPFRKAAHTVTVLAVRHQREQDYH